MSENSGDPKLGGWYAHYVLIVLVLVYVFNFIDRNILSILSQDILTIPEDEILSTEVDFTIVGGEVRGPA